MGCQREEGGGLEVCADEFDGEPIVEKMEREKMPERRGVRSGEGEKWRG